MEEILDRKKLRRYFTDYFGCPVQIGRVETLGKNAGAKGFGYGVPVRIHLEGAPVSDVVLHLAGPAGFGHDTLTDRAVEALVPYETFNSLPHHVPAFDVGVLDGLGHLVSLREVQDFFYVTGYAQGEPYFKDLERLMGSGAASARDRQRTDTLADALVGFHADRLAAPELYRRRTRDLFGHHECIAGLLDSYDDFSVDEFTSRSALRDIELRCVDWRHRLKRYTHRLCRVHGDFHPWNVLFRPDDTFTLLDRSRGEWGEAADDVSCMAINYLFFSIRTHGRLTEPFAGLWERFFARYLDATGDQECLELIQPFFVFRALVVASPLWYPDLTIEVRRNLFRLIDRVLSVDRFDWRGVNALLAE